jgi:hypothetical protein
MKCPHCEFGFLRRQVPHPYTREHLPVTVTRICPHCHGTKTIEQPSLLDVQTVEGTK